MVFLREVNLFIFNSDHENYNIHTLNIHSSFHTGLWNKYGYE